MRAIAEKDQYSIRVDEHKNRLYLDLRGFWSDAHEVSDYIDDLAAATAYLTPGFTIVTEAVELHPAPLDVIAVHVQAQKLLIDAGLSRTAEILPAEGVARMSAQRFSRESGMIQATFTSREEAEAWLDN